eukprot:g21337.t1
MNLSPSRSQNSQDLVFQRSLLNYDVQCFDRFLMSCAWNLAKMDDEVLCAPESTVQEQHQYSRSCSSLVTFASEVAQDTEEILGVGGYQQSWNRCRCEPQRR